MYEFGAAEFKDFVWIRQGTEFSNVSLVELEMISTGAFRLEVVRGGNVISSGARVNAGWSTFDFRSGMNPPVVSGMSPYQLRFMNASPGLKKIKHGQITP